MSLTPGTRLGPYEITALIGEGGMGKVWRAHHTALQRDDALKVLPDAFASDPDRLARFRREAQVLASLNHPNIAHVYGLEQADGMQALVMELVEGPTLADRIAQGPIPLDEALPTARQIAEALEAAHEHGIVHRDLKPANIKVRADGAVKVLDFGLAKAIEPASVDTAQATASPTITTPAMTQAGVILGTAAYMSPEQVRSRPVDKRADIWAFGCVLFEMLTGRQAFERGDTVSDAVASILKGEPDWPALPATTPPHVHTLLRRCLQKDVQRRLPHIGIARLEIDDGLAATASGLTSTVMSVRSQRFPPNVLVASAVAAASAAAVFALAFVMLPPRPAGDTQVTRASLLPPPDATWASVPPATRFTLSPDGRFLAFLATSRDGRTRLWLRALDALTARPLPGTDGALVATWSPDSRFLAFSAGGKLRKVDVSGGPPITLADMSSNNGITWSADDVILFPPDPAAGIFRVPSSGGTAARVTTLDAASGDARHWQPFFLPDNRRFLYHAVGTTTSPNEARAIFVGSLNPTEKGREILRGGSNAQYASGYLLFMRDTTLMAQRFNIQGLELFGEALPVAEHIQIGGTSGRTGAFSVSRAGALVYQTGGPVEFRSQLEWLDRTGKQIGVLGGAEDQMSVELSPDGTHVLASLLGPERRGRDLWIYDVRQNRRDRLTFDVGDELTGTWSPDGTQIVFNSRRTSRFDLYRKAASGAGSEELLLSDGHDKVPYSWSDHDQLIAYANRTPSATATEDLWTIPLSGARKPTEFLQTEFGESRPRFSPDGRWLAYVSNELGQPQVFVTPFPARSSKWQVSTAGGDWPRWRRDGKELFYISPDDTLMVAAVSGKGAAFHVGVVEPLFKARPRRTAYSGAVEYAYDVSADGQRFLVNTLLENASMDPITVLVNWPALLKK